MNRCTFIADGGNEDSFSHVSETTTGPMDVYRNSHDVVNAILLAYCVLEPENYPSFQKDLTLRGNKALFDPPTERGAMYAEYHVARGGNEGTATNVFRTSCIINHVSWS